MPGCTKIITLPGIATTSKRPPERRPRPGRPRPSAGAAPWRAPRRASAGRGRRPTTSTPRAASSIATRPVPHPASSTLRGEYRWMQSASPWIDWPRSPPSRPSVRRTPPRAARSAAADQRDDGRAHRNSGTTGAISSGVVIGGNRRTTLPSRSTRNFSKFHVMSALSPSPGCAALRNRYSGAAPVAVDLDLGEHGEVDVVLRGRELEDLGVGARFLGAELVAREAEHLHVVELVVERTQTCVLRREASSARDVDDHEHLTAELFEVDQIAGDARHLELVDR